MTLVLKYKDGKEIEIKNAYGFYSNGKLYFRTWFDSAYSECNPDEYELIHFID